MFTVTLHFVFKRLMINLEFLENLKVSLDYYAKVWKMSEIFLNR